MGTVGSPPAPRGKLVVAHPERKAQRALHRLVGATLCPVEIVADLDALAAAVDADTIAVVDAALALERPQLREQPARAWIAAAGDGAAPLATSVIEALLTAGWHHVVAHPMPILAEELLATVQKLLRGDPFGLEKYMAWGAEIRSYTLANARDREAAVNALARDVVAVGLPARIGSLVSVIADELLANAIYVAPLDGAGKRHRVAEPRDRARALAGRDAVTLRWATDARYLAIEIRDHWGSLAPSVVTGRLAGGSGSRHAGPTATAATPSDGGMGLPLAYACCNQFVVNTCANACTELIALLDVRYKPTELGRSASFHTFVGEAPAA